MARKLRPLVVNGVIVDLDASGPCLMSRSIVVSAGARACRRGRGSSSLMTNDDGASVRRDPTEMLQTRQACHKRYRTCTNDLVVPPKRNISPTTTRRRAVSGDLTANR